MLESVRSLGNLVEVVIIRSAIQQVLCSPHSALQLRSSSKAIKPRKLYAHKCWLQDDDQDNELSDRLLSLSKGINQSAEQCQIHESELEVPGYPSPSYRGVL